MALPQIGIINEPATEGEKGEIWTPYGDWSYEGPATLIFHNQTSETNPDVICDMFHYKIERVPEKGEPVIFDPNSIVKNLYFADEYVPAVLAYLKSRLDVQKLQGYPFLLTALDLFRQRIELGCDFYLKPITSLTTGKSTSSYLDEHVAVYGEVSYPLLMPIKKVEIESIAKWQSLLAILRFEDFLVGLPKITAYIANPETDE